MRDRICMYIYIYIYIQRGDIEGLGFRGLNSLKGSIWGSITRIIEGDARNLVYSSYELLSKLLVSPLVTPIIYPYIIPHISPL